MNKKLVVLMCVGAATGVHAQGNVTIYGSVDIAVTATSNSAGAALPGKPAVGGKTTRTALESGIGPGSRLGFRGSEDLGSGMNAFFTAEMGVAYDTGTLQQGGLGFGRQIFVGLGTKDWSISAGRHYSPMDLAFGGSDAMNGLWWGNPVGASGHALYPSVGSVGGSGTHNATARVDNSVLGTFKAGPWTGKLLFGAGNENSRRTGRILNPAITYASGNFQFDASILRMNTPESMLRATAKPEIMKEWVMGASYNFGFMRLYGGVYEFQGPQDASRLSPLATVGSSSASAFAYSWDKTRSVWVSANIPLGPGKLLLALSRQSYDYRWAQDGRSITFGATYDYPLSKRTSLYASGGMVRNDERARTPLIATITAVTPNGYGSDTKAFSFGMQHRF